MSDRINPALKDDNIAVKAIEIVHGERNAHYGHPIDNHTATAALWQAFLRKRFGVLVVVTPRDVCMLNMLQKICRDAHEPKEDNLVDIAGYAMNAEIVSLPGNEARE